MSLANVLEQLQIIEDAITGVERAHQWPPASIEEFPTFVTFVDDGVISRFPDDRTETGKRTVVHTLQTILYVGSSEMFFVEAHSLAAPFVETCLTAFEANITLNGACLQQIPRSYALREFEYAGVNLWGLLFELGVTERTATTFAA